MVRTLTMAEADDSTPLYASIDGQVAPVSSHECVFRDPRSGVSHLLPIAAVEALDACREFAPLAMHAHSLAQRQPQLPPAAIMQGLESLRARKLLLEDGEFLTPERARVEPVAPLRTVFIRACDRPAQLRRLLESLAGNEAVHRAGLRYVVLDDSHDATAMRAHDDLTAGFARTAHVRAIHLGGERWTAVAERLAAPAPAGARAALGRTGASGARFGGGKGYNLAALLGAGATYALLDDDFVLPLAYPHDAMPGIDLAGDPDSTTRFHDSADAALAAGLALGTEPFAHASALCGQRLGDVWQREPWRVTRADLLGYAPSHAPRVTADARIATLTHGHRGDSGAQSTRWMYLLDATSRREFASDPDRYARNLEGGAVWFGSPRARVDTQTAFTPFAIDARGFVPPTVADGRSEDLVFGALVAACDPAGVALHSNLTIGHRQERTRSRSGTLGDASTPVSNQWLADLLTSASAELHADTPAGRVVSLSNVLLDAAAASPARRLEMVSNYLGYARADMATRLAAVRDAATDAPDYWRRDVDRMIEAQRRALLEPPPARFSDWPIDERDAAGRVAMLLESFAAVLAAWPALLDHAARCADSLLQD